MRWSRREFCSKTALVGGLLATGKCTLDAFAATAAQKRPMVDVAAVDRARVLAAADRYLSEKPMTVTASRSPRSPGGVHDFYSEGDYWWPDPNNPGGPYIRRDGFTNPENFTAHARPWCG